MEAPGAGLPPATLLPALHWAESVLRRGRIDEARLNAELLLCHLLSCDRLRLYVDFEKILGEEELAAYAAMVRRRLAHEPLQYITGRGDFMGLEFAVDGRVLIPRPETETLVEQMLAFRAGDPRPSFTVLDAGVGSGNIAVSLARHGRGIRVVGIDASAGALAVAAGNVARHGVGDRVELVRCDLFSDPLPFGPGRFDAVVSNPPYIPAAEIAGLDPEVRLHEPSAATTDGGDGLSFFRRLAAAGDRLLRPGGMLMVETGYNQARVVLGIFTEAGYREGRIVRDLSGVERVVAGTR